MYYLYILQLFFGKNCMFSDVVILTKASYQQPQLLFPGIKNIVKRFLGHNFKKINLRFRDFSGAFDFASLSEIHKICENCSHTFCYL